MELSSVGYKARLEAELDTKRGPDADLSNNMAGVRVIQVIARSGQCS